MGRNLAILRWLLLLGAIYFMGISIAHMLGIKIPLLYVYFNIPSTVYQDRIISLLAFGWAIFLYMAHRDPLGNPGLLAAFIFAGIGAIVGLSIINITTDFQAMGSNIHEWIFWLETGLLAGYVASLIWFILRVKCNNTIH